MPHLPKPAHSPSSPLNVHEIDHLEYSHRISTGSFSSNFENSLWNKTTFQISHSESSIRIAVDALATLLRQQNRNPPPTTSMPSKPSIIVLTDQTSA